MARDVLLRRIPTVLRQDLYAVPALAGAAVVVGADAAGWHGAVFPLLGLVVCFVIRVIGLRFGVQLPLAPSMRHGDADDTEDRL